MLYDVVMGHFISRWLILTVAAGVMVAVLPACMPSESLLCLALLRSRCSWR